MKKHIYLYLFIFASLIALYQFVSADNYVKVMDKKLKQAKSNTERFRDSVNVLNGQLADSRLFTLQYNEEARGYYERFNMDPDAVAALVADTIYDTNIYEGESHPLIPYEGNEGKMKINSVHLLNHKFLIADFSDSRQWGDLLIRYDFDEKNELSLKVIDAVLYPQ